MGNRAATLLARMLELDAILIDIRFKPWSKLHDGEYQKERLRELFGPTRYRWWGLEWGNINYKNGKAFEYNDFQAGVKALPIINKPAVVLLCGCRNEVECHRGDIGKRLRRIGFTVRSLEWRG